MREEIADKNSTVAVILAAGKGSRLRQETPKPLTEINGKPLIDYALSALISSRFKSTEIIVVTGHKAELVESHCLGDVIIARQEIQQGNLDALAKSLERLPPETENILVIQADDCLHLSQETIRDLLLFHERTNAQATLLLTVQFEPTLHKTQYSIDGTGKIIKIESANPQSVNRGFNTGIYCFKRTFIEESLIKIEADPSRNNEKTIPQLLLLAMQENRPIFGFVLQQPWTAINTPEQLERARNAS